MIQPFASNLKEAAAIIREADCARQGRNQDLKMKTII